MNKSNKRTIILLVILLILVMIGYPMIKGNSVEPLASQASNEPIISEQVKKMLDDLTSAKLDISVLQSPELLELNDLTLPLIGVPVGRVNPFASIR